MATPVSLAPAAPVSATAAAVVATQSAASASTPTTAPTTMVRVYNSAEGALIGVVDGVTYKVVGRNFGSLPEALATQWGAMFPDRIQDSAAAVAAAQSTNAAQKELADKTAQVAKLEAELASLKSILDAATSTSTTHSDTSVV